MLIPAPSRLAILIALAGLVASVGPQMAYADATLEVLGHGKIAELSHKLEIRFGPQVFEVDETFVVANKKKGSDAEARYTFELPAQAAITNLSVETANGQRSNYAVVGAEASTRLIENPSATHKPDMGLVRMIRSEGSDVADRNEYELRVFPIPADRTTTIKLKWKGSVNMVAGNYSMRLPARGQATSLARTEIIVASTATMHQLYGGETLLSKRSRPGKKHRFFAPTEGDLVIQARPSERVHGARAEIALYPLSADSGVAAVRVSLPDAAQSPVPSIDRAILVVDTSSSMKGAGIEAAAKLIDGLLGELGETTRVQAVVYERDARNVLGDLLPASRTVRSQILRDIRAANGGNGSNLGSALKRARAIMDADPGADMSKTLIVLISDGMIPTGLSGNAAADLLGANALAKANLLTAVLVPHNAPLPDVQQSALGDMMRRGKGRLVALRHKQATALGASLLRELGQPAALDTLQVELSSGDWVGANLAGQLQPGSSITALGFYQGKMPKRVTLSGMRAGVPETLVAKKLPASQTRALAAIAVANASPFGMPGVGTTANQSQEALRQAASKLGVVTQVSAGAAVANDDGYAADRIRTSQRWGMQTYRRLPPPAERANPGNGFPEFAIRARHTSTQRGRTGQLDKKMISRRVKAHVIPHARRCYEKLLRQDHEAAGALQLHIELARGEVLHAEVSMLPPRLEPIRTCLEDAMYAMPVPIVRQGQAAELVSIANYPLRFRKAKEKGRKPTVEPTTLDMPDPMDDPLLGLPE